LRPDPGLGYLVLDPARSDGLGEVERFIEKPTAEAAARLIADGALWNGGMFFARADRVLAELARHLPSTHVVLHAIGDALARSPEAAARVTAEAYPRLPAISFDHGVMERTDRVLVVIGSFGWSDLGTWPALAAWGEE